MDNNQVKSWAILSVFSFYLRAFVVISLLPYCRSINKVKYQLQQYLAIHKQNTDTNNGEKRDLNERGQQVG